MNIKLSIFSLAVALCALVTGCQNESGSEQAMVREVKMPSPTDPILEMSSVAIEGSGFVPTDKIILVGIPSKAETEVEAEVTEVSSTKLTFIVPEQAYVGENSVTLRRGTQDQLLGSITVGTPAPKKYIKSIGTKNKLSENGQQYDALLIFTYDAQKRIVKYEAPFMWNGGPYPTTTNYVYSGGSFTASGVDANNSPTTGSGTIDDRGRLMLLSLDATETRSASQFRVEYNPSGYVSKATSIYNYRVEGRKEYVYRMTWTNGNITGVRGEGWTTYTFTYGDLPNYTNVDGILLFDDLALGENNGFNLGRTGKNLLSRSQRQNDGGYDPTAEYIRDYVYTLDAEGCPTRIELKQDGAVKYVVDITYW